MAAVTIHSDFGAQENKVGQKKEILVPVIMSAIYPVTLYKWCLITFFLMDEIALWLF